MITSDLWIYSFLFFAFNHIVNNWHKQHQAVSGLCFCQHLQFHNFHLYCTNCCTRYNKFVWMYIAHRRSYERSSFYYINRFGVIFEIDLMLSVRLCSICRSQLLNYSDEICYTDGYKGYSTTTCYKGQPPLIWWFILKNKQFSKHFHKNHWLIIIQRTRVKWN